MTEPATLQNILAARRTVRFLDDTTLDQQRCKVCAHLQACRTAALGGMQLQCDRCETEPCWYFGCRDRHCPQCQHRATHQWAERQQDHLLPVRYYHLVFTLPHALNGWVQLHPEVLYRLLFEATRGTLRAFGQDPKHPGGELGLSAVLHTRGQNLSQPVHLHCLVPGGALDEDGHWKPTRGNYLFPVKALSRHFRGRMVGLLRQAATKGELHRVTRPGEVDAVLNTLMASDWVVYTKECLDHTGTVVEYLARYTHRIAITNARLLQVDDRQVRFRYRDYRDGNRSKTLCLDGEEFVRRFLLHVLPKGFMRVRHRAADRFGFLANRGRREKLARIRQALAVVAAVVAETAATEAAGYPCPQCRMGRLRVIALLPPLRRRWEPPG